MYRILILLRTKWELMSLNERRYASWHAMLDGLIFGMLGYALIHMFRGESIQTAGVAIWSVILYFRWKQARERWQL